MSEHRIQNFDSLATTPVRTAALQIAEAGLAAIDTAQIISQSISLSDNTLRVKDQTFDISQFKRIRVIGFGKASCDAAFALEKILGSNIKDGIVIGLETAQCEVIETYAGSHPRPSSQNVAISKKIFDMSETSVETDLVIAIISGGGSALLCWPEDECAQGQELYDKFLSTGGTIQELNLVRKHISYLKGGGLAKALYPATVVGLIFSDVPGNHYDQVASGPTYKDVSTIADAEKIIRDRGLGEFKLIETPKEDKYFEKVHNIVLVSNETALEAMASKARELGLAPHIISSEMYDAPKEAVEDLVKESTSRGKSSVILAAGEPILEVKKHGGSGGRCSYMALEAIDKLPAESAAIFLASDGIDNSLSAGAIVDTDSLHRSTDRGLNAPEAKENFDSGTFFQNLGDLIMTGPTGANVSDLMCVVVGPITT